MNIPEEIREARILFEKAEKSVLPQHKHRLFNEAVEILNSYKDENPEMLQAEKNLVRNLRLTNTRRLLLQLGDIEDIDLETWVDFTILFITKLDDEISSVTKQDPIVKTKYNQFIKIWREEILQSLSRC